MPATPIFSPQGSTGTLQFNDGGIFGAASGLVWSEASRTLTLTAGGTTGAALARFNPSAGSSFTQINDNGTVVIDADSATGSNPLTVRYVGTMLWQMTFGGHLVSGTSGLINLGGGLVHYTASGGVAQVKTFNELHVLCGNLGGSGTRTMTVDSADAATNTATNVLTLSHQTSGTPVANFGAALRLQLESSTTANQDAGRHIAQWLDATHLTRRGCHRRTAYDAAAERETDRGWSDGSAGRFAAAAPASAPTDSHIAASQVSFWVNESGNELTFRVCYADGATYKSGTVALT